MADYRLSATIISRSTGRNVVAAAAYRAGEKLRNERSGTVEDYSPRSWSVLYREILTPENAPQWMRDRERLWNAVEHREDRSTKPDTAQLARDLELSLPHEFTHEQRVKLVCDFIKAEFVDRGMVADIAIHAPPRRGDGTNHHAHVLLTMRDIEDGGFGGKNRDWNRDELLDHWRERWADYQNRALEQYGFEARVDHRSLKDQGIDREPTQHLGPDAQAMEDQGKHTDRGDQNRQIKNANDNLALLEKELAASDKRIAELRRQLAAERMAEIQKTVRAVDAAYEKAEHPQAPAPQRPPEPEPPAPAKQPEPRPPIPRPPRPSAAERIQQAQKIIRAVDAAYEKAERPAPSPDHPPEPEPPAPAKQPEIPAVIPGSAAPRRPPPSRYAKLVGKQNYAARAEEERKQEAERAKEREQKAERERERDPEQERERKPDRDR